MKEPGFECQALRGSKSFVLFEMRRTQRMQCVVYEESARLIGGKGRQLTFLIPLGPQDPA